jgi:hypothetical protein
LDRSEKAALAILLLSSAALGATLVLPQVSFPQAVSYEGPAVPYGNSTYSISGYYIPTVNQGAFVRVDLSGYSPSSVILSLFPTAQSTLSPTGPPLLTFSLSPEPDQNATILSPSTQAYGIYVVSYNDTSFRLGVSSVWSPFYDYRIYSAPAVFFLIASGIAFYYFRLTAARRRWEEEAMEELRRKTKPAAPG